jgi:hypothetical protein
MVHHDEAEELQGANVLGGNLQQMDMFNLKIVSALGTCHLQSRVAKKEKSEEEVTVASKKIKAKSKATQKSCPTYHFCR